MSIAVLSDIHGNRWALEEILNSIKDQGIKKIVNLGDSLYGPLDPAGTARILIDLGIPTIRGNEDRLILDTNADEVIIPSLSFVRKSLKKKHLYWLKKLPMVTALNCLFYLCHGTPEKDDAYLLEGVGEKGVYLRSAEEIIPLIAGIKLPVILCGHSHIPGKIQIPDGPMIINPGSVGLPAYEDEHPYPHRIETGTPHARYAILAQDYDDWEVEFKSVEYDWGTASKIAKENHRPDWAYWLKTGKTSRRKRSYSDQANSNHLLT